jgi:hypothetical protein
MRLRLLIPAVYLTLGILVWIDFARTNPDGLANIGLVLFVAPVTLVGLAWMSAAGADSFPLIPNGLPYLMAHAVFYFPSLLITAILLFLIVASIQRFFRRSRRLPAARPPREV